MLKPTKKIHTTIFTVLWRYFLWFSAQSEVTSEQNPLKDISYIKIISPMLWAFCTANNKIIRCPATGSYMFGVNIHRQNRSYTFCVNWGRKQRQATYVQRNIEARSCNHCCTVKSNKYYIFYVCVCSLRYAHTTYGHTWSAPRYNIFPHYVIKGTVFERKVIEHNMCFHFLYNFCPERFLILGRTESDRIKNVRGCSRKVPVILVRF